MNKSIFRRALWAPTGAGVALTTIYLSVLWLNDNSAKPLDATGMQGQDAPVNDGTEEVPPPQEKGEDTEDAAKKEDKDEKEGEKIDDSEKQNQADEPQAKDDEKKDDEAEEAPKDVPDDSSKKETVKNTNGTETAESTTIAASLGNLSLEEYIKLLAKDIKDHGEGWVDNKETLINSWRITSKVKSLNQALEEYLKNQKEKKAS